jgi:hypothetical protein
MNQGLPRSAGAQGHPRRALNRAHLDNGAAHRRSRPDRFYANLHMKRREFMNLLRFR